MSAVSGGFHPDANLDALVVKFAIELLRLVGMLQSPLAAFPRVGLNERDALEARVII
jgi:hypothetical protein